MVALVWFINGLFCKVMNLVPRHQQIVERVLEIDNARLLTFFFGLAEIAMAVWIIAGFSPRINVLLQIIIIGIMNTLEFIFAPDLLLWGKTNALFALLFMILIAFNEFYLHKPKST